MKKTGLFIALTAICLIGRSQIDSSLLKRQSPDTARPKMNMDAIYNRPFLTSDKVPLSLGGYVEGNYQHLSTDGVSQGHQFQFRRLSLFMASSISRRIKFLTEIEFESGDGEEEGSQTEIDFEYAALDIEFYHLLNFRGGIILNPIGAFNQNHDGPKWEFTDRPIAMTEMLPGTWSNAGFGIFGKQYQDDWMFGYELYLTGGFSDDIIDNDRGMTYLPEAKERPGRFMSSENGQALFTGKVAARHNKIGEVGLSYMSGIYNQYIKDGAVIDNARRLDVLALDANTTLPYTKTRIVAEWAWVGLQLPENYTRQYGNRQMGGFADLIQPVLKGNLMGWSDAVFNLACRFEYVDWNVGTFNETGDRIGDELWSVMPGTSFRPSPRTVLRLNYRYLRSRDFFYNSPSLTGGFIVGFSTYF